MADCTSAKEHHCTGCAEAAQLGIKPNCPHCGHNMWVYELNVYGTLACQRHGWNSFATQYHCPEVSKHDSND